MIDNVAYDTTNLPEPPPGKINVIKIYQASTRNEIREWVCDRLKFATVASEGDWTSDPSASLEFNWPYNDLYFTEGCEGGDTVNLVPC